MAEEKVLTEEEKERFKAEADKFRAEAERIRAEEERDKREEEWWFRERDLEERRLLAEAKAAEHSERLSEMEMLRHEKAFQADMSMDIFHHVYRFTQSVSESSVKDCISKLVYWDRINPTCEIEIIFTSPGGSVIDGLVLFDHIQDFRQKGHTITTTTFGWAASMAGILLQAGDKRVIRKEAWILIHEVSFGTSGKIGEIEDTVNWIKRIQERVLDIFVSRCAQAAKNGTATNPLTKAQLKKHWQRTDWWISSDEALKYGLVDEVM